MAYRKITQTGKQILLELQGVESPLQKTIIRVTKYIHDKKIELVIIPGTSAQGAALAVKETWKRIYPNEKMPSFIATGVLKWRTRFMSDELLEKTLKQRLGKWLEKKDANLFVLDEFMSKGTTILRTKRILRKNGFRKIKTGVLSRMLEHIAHQPRLSFNGDIGPTPYFHNDRRERITKMLKQRVGLGKYTLDHPEDCPPRLRFSKWYKQIKF